MKVGWLVLLSPFVHAVVAQKRSFTVLFYLSLFCNSPTQLYLGEVYESKAGTTWPPRYQGTNVTSRIVGIARTNPTRDRYLTNFRIFCMHKTNSTPFVLLQQCKSSSIYAMHFIYIPQYLYLYISILLSICSIVHVKRAKLLLKSPFYSSFVPPYETEQNHTGINFYSRLDCQGQIFLFNRKSTSVTRIRQNKAFHPRINILTFFDLNLMTHFCY